MGRVVWMADRHGEGAFYTDSATTDRYWGGKLAYVRDMAIGLIQKEIGRKVIEVSRDDLKNASVSFYRKKGEEQPKRIMPDPAIIRAYGNIYE